MRRCSFDQVKRCIYAARATVLGNLFATRDHPIIARLTLDFRTSALQVRG